MTIHYAEKSLLHNQFAGNATAQQAHAPATSRWWRLGFQDGASVDVSCTPAASYAYVIMLYPDANGATPFNPTMGQPTRPMTAEEETAVRAWLELIEESDPATIAEVIGQWQRDADARSYFIDRNNTKGN